MTLLIEASIADGQELSSNDVLNKKETEIVDRFVKTGIPEYIKLSGAFSREWLEMHRIMMANEGKYTPKIPQSGTDNEEPDLEQRPQLIIWLQNLHKKFEHLPLPSTLLENSAEKEYGIKPRKQKPITGTDGKKYDVAPSTILDTARDYLLMTEREEPWMETTGERVLKRRDKTIDNVEHFTGKVESNEGYSAEIKNNLGDLKKISGELNHIRVIGSIYEHLHEPKKFSDTVTQAQYNAILDNLETRVGRLVVTPEGVPKSQKELLDEISALYQELRAFDKDNTKQKDDRLNELNTEVKDMFVISKRYQTFFAGAIDRYRQRWGYERAEEIRKKVAELDLAVGQFSDLIKQHKKDDKILELTKERLHEEFASALRQLKYKLREPFIGGQENFFDAEYREFKDLFGENLLGAEELKSAFTGLESHTFERKYTEVRQRQKSDGHGNFMVDDNYRNVIENYNSEVHQETESSSSVIKDTDGKGKWNEQLDKAISLRLDLSELDKEFLKEALFDFYMEPDIHNFVQQVKAGLADPKDWVLFAVAPQKNFHWEMSENKKRELAEQNKSSREDKALEKRHDLYLGSRTEAFYLNNFVNTTQLTRGQFQWRLMPTKPTRDYIVQAGFDLVKLKIGEPTITEAISGEPQEAGFLDPEKRRLADIFEIQQYQFMRMKQQRANAIEGYDLDSPHRSDDKPTLVVSTNGIRPGQLSYYGDNMEIGQEHRKNIMQKAHSGDLKQRDFAVASIAHLQYSIRSDVDRARGGHSKSDKARWIAEAKERFDRELPKLVAHGYNVR